MEESASDLVNWLADGLYDVISGQSESEWKQMIREYELAGYGANKAFSLAVADRAKNLMLSAAGGMLSGGIMSGAGAAIDYRTARTENKAAEKRSRVLPLPAPGAEKTASGTETAGEQYAIKILPDGKKYVKADRQVIFGNDPDSWSEQLEEYINGKIRKGENVQLIAEDGDVLTLTQRTAGKVSSPFNSDGSRMPEEEFARKVSAGSHIDELAQVSKRGKRIKADVGARHGDDAFGGWNYRTAYFLDEDGKYYKTKISVQIGQDGNAVYNIGDMEERSFPTIAGSSANGGALSGEKTSSADSIPATAEKSQGEKSPVLALGAYGTNDPVRQARFRQAEKIAKIFGTELRAVAPRNGAAASYYNGVISIDPNVSDPVQTLLLHELTHHMERKTGYDRYASAVVDHLREKNGEKWIAGMEREIRADYQKRGVELDAPGVRKELVAKYSETLQDETFAKRLAREDPSVVQRIIDWCTDQIAKLGAELRGDKDAAFLVDMRRMYENALRSAQSGKPGSMEQYSISSELDKDLQAVLDGTFESDKGEVYTGETSNFLVEDIGANSLPEYIPPKKAYAAMVSEEDARAAGRYEKNTNYHALGKEGLMQALEASENPVAAFAAPPDENGNKRLNRIVLVTDMTVGSEAVVVIEEVEDTALSGRKRITANKQISAYPREQIVNDILKAADQKRLLHFDKERCQNLGKKRSQNSKAGVQGSNSLAAIPQVDFTDNIRRFWDNVNWKKSGKTHMMFGDSGGKTAVELAFEKAQAEKDARNNPQNAVGRNFRELSDDVFDELTRSEPPEAEDRSVMERLRQKDLDEYWEEVERLADAVADEDDANMDPNPDPEDLVQTDVQREKVPLREKGEDVRSFIARKFFDAGDAVTQIQKQTGDRHLYSYFNQARASANAAVQMIEGNRFDTLGRNTGDGPSRVGIVWTSSP